MTISVKQILLDSFNNKDLQYTLLRAFNIEEYQYMSQLLEKNTGDYLLVYSAGENYFVYVVNYKNNIYQIEIRKNKISKPQKITDQILFSKKFTIRD